MTKIGIISFAHMHAHDYAIAIGQMDNVELVAIYDADRQRGETAANTYQSTFYDNLESFLSHDMDAVIVTSENIHHKKHVIAAAQSGLDILCEKPIATTVEDAKLMIQTCEEHKVKLQIAYPVRFCDAIKKGKEIVESNDLGVIQFINTTNRGRNPGGWFIDSELSGGGAVLDHTVHMVDVVRWYTGSEVISVNAQIDTMFSDEVIDDAGIIDLVFDNGIHMTHDCSWSKNQKYPTWGDVTIELVGTKGSLIIDAFKDYFLSYNDEDPSIQEYFSGNDMNYELIEDFIAGVKGEQAVSITGFDGLKSLETALTSYESARKNKVINI